jgi:hypothetical protein
MYRPAQVQLDLASGELLKDRPGVGQGASKPVKFGHHQGVIPAGRHRLPQPRTFPVDARQPVVNVDPRWSNAETLEGVALGGEVLPVSGNPSRLIGGHDSS